MAEQMQGDCSLLCPGYLLAECLRLPKVQICIGTFLRAAPELPAALPEGVVLAPCKPGRPAKGTVRPASETAYWQVRWASFSRCRSSDQDAPGKHERALRAQENVRALGS